MFRKRFKYTLIASLLLVSTHVFSQNDDYDRIYSGAENPELYLSLIYNKKVAVVTNATGMLYKGTTLYSTSDKKLEKDMHLVDFLISRKVNVKKIFSPEHGFRGDADAGESVSSEVDSKTGLTIVSLYGDHKKPTSQDLDDVDIVLYDIQDVGVRFFTYISTLHYILESAAENGKKVIILDRPNPNGFYVDGPVLKEDLKSFVGMHPVPIVYGMTVAEYAQMVNGEGWLKNGSKADLTIIPLKNYRHTRRYILPVKPSPNLPNAKSINLYPSTCLFEGFNGSEGRGTDKPFVLYGSPYLQNMPIEFIPRPNFGSKNPRFNGQICYGEDLSETPELQEINLKWLINAYKNYQGNEPFFIKQSGEFWIDKLAGTDELRKQIEQGWDENQIKATWQKDLEEFKKMREKYLLYP